MELQDDQPQMFFLKWNNFTANLTSAFDQLKNDGTFIDVTLISADRKVIRAHKLILSIGSKYLEEILAMNPSDHPTIILSNIYYRELKLLVDFIYSGELSVNKTMLNGLMEAARILEIRGLCSVSEQTDGVPGPLSPPTTTTAPRSTAPFVEREIEAGAPRKRRRTSELTQEDVQAAPGSFGTQNHVPATVQGSFNAYLLKTPERISPEKNKSGANQALEVSADIPRFESNPMPAMFPQLGAEMAAPTAPEVPKPPTTPPTIITDQMLHAMRLNLLPLLSQLAAFQQNGSFLPAALPGAFPFNPQETDAPSSTPELPTKNLLEGAPIRRYKKYTEETLMTALAEIIAGQSINRTSQKYNIPARTLRDWMKRLKIKSAYTHNNSRNKKEGSIGSNSSSPEPEMSNTQSCNNPNGEKMGGKAEMDIIRATTGPAANFMAAKSSLKIDDTKYIQGLNIVA